MLPKTSVYKTNIAVSDEGRPSEGTELLFRRKYPPEASLARKTHTKRTAEKGTPQGRRREWEKGWHHP